MSNQWTPASPTPMRLETWGSSIVFCWKCLHPSMLPLTDARRAFPVKTQFPNASQSLFPGLLEAPVAFPPSPSPPSIHSDSANS